MATNAASEAILGELHSQVARVFTQVMKTYERRLDVLDNIKTEELTKEVLELLMASDHMPNPAMLAAVTKFLKDNTIAFDTLEIEALSATQERLEARREKRGNLVNLQNLSLVAPSE